MKWLWKLFGYNTENDIKRQKILDFQFTRAMDFFDKKEIRDSKTQTESPSSKSK